MRPLNWKTRRNLLSFQRPFYPPFQKELGTTPLQYINQKKIEKAQLLLITEELAVKEIAFQLAFDDYSYFNRLFKKQPALLPKNTAGYIETKN